MLFTAAAFTGGASFGCFILFTVSRVALKTEKKRVESCRFICACSAASICAVCAALPFVLYSSQSSFKILLSLKLFFGLFAAAGLLSAFFYRSFFPVLVLIYTLYAGISAVSLQLYSGGQRSVHQLRVTGESVTVDGLVLPFLPAPPNHSPNPVGKIGIVVETFRLPDHLLLPIKKNWYRFAGVQPFISPVLSAPPADSDMPHIIALILSLSAVDIQVLELSVSSAVSVRYSLIPSVLGTKVSFSLIPAP